jgi:hypothetical protein
MFNSVNKRSHTGGVERTVASDSDDGDKDDDDEEEGEDVDGDRLREDEKGEEEEDDVSNGIVVGKEREDSSTSTLALNFCIFNKRSFPSKNTFRINKISAGTSASDVK